MNLNPKTRTRSWTRWLLAGVATIVAAVVALIMAAYGVLATGSSDTPELPPRSTTTTTAPTTPTTPTTTVPPPATLDLETVDWDEVAFPMDCGPVGVKALQVELATPEPGHQVAVVLTACDAGAGSPPRSLFVYDGAGSTTTPHLLQSLASDGLARLTKDVTVDGASLVATGSSYSSADVPRCCPDDTFRARWNWTGDGYSPA